MARKAKSSWWGFALALWALTGCGEAVDVESETPPAPQRGASLFVEHCSACHGRDARGNGPIARGLIALPADLTQIAARRDGVFPNEEVRRTIDGRSERAGHRGPEMPRWGEFWNEFDTSAGDEEAAAKIDSLVGYLESIQQSGGAAESAGATRERMTRLAAALETALPAVFSDAAFGDPEFRRAFLDAVALMGVNAEVLEAHAESSTFAPLARSLARDAERARSALEAGQPRKTRFRFGELLENCVACHARLPSSQDWAFGPRLIEGIDAGALSTHEELRLLWATRQFATARDRYESLLLEASGDEFEGWGLLTDYLIVCLRVLDDIDRPRRLLAQLAEREEVAAPRLLELQGWVDSLDAVASQPAAGGPRDRARALLRASQDLRRGAGAGAGLVYDIAASGELFRFIESAPQDVGELADAYYLLGLTEARIRRPIGRERWDDYLEAAIRLAPGTPTSRGAFALFEENRLAQFSGFSVLALPRDELRRIETLRDLAFAMGAER